MKFDGLISGSNRFPHLWIFFHREDHESCKNRSERDSVPAGSSKKKGNGISFSFFVPLFFISCTTCGCYMRGCRTEEGKTLNRKDKFSLFVRRDFQNTNGRPFWIHQNIPEPAACAAAVRLPVIPQPNKFSEVMLKSVMRAAGTWTPKNNRSYFGIRSNNPIRNYRNLHVRKKSNKNIEQCLHGEYQD